MFPVDDLVQVAEDLRRLAVDATYVILYGPHGGVEGLEVGEDFFLPDKSGKKSFLGGHSIPPAESIAKG